DRRVEHATGRDQGYVTSATQPDGTTQPELWSCLMDGWLSRFSQAEITRPLMLHHCPGCELGLYRIAWRHYNQTRERSKNGPVFRRVMAHAQAPVRKATAYRDDFYVGLVVAGIIADLLQAPQGCKVRN